MSLVISVEDVYVYIIFWTLFFTHFPLRTRGGLNRWSSCLQCLATNSRGSICPARAVSVYQTHRSRTTSSIWIHRSGLADIWWFGEDLKTRWTWTNMLFFGLRVNPPKYPRSQSISLLAQLSQFPPSRSAALRDDHHCISKGFWPTCASTPPCCSRQMLQPVLSWETKITSSSMWKNLPIVVRG